MKKPYIAAVDPGINGAIAVINPSLGAFGLVAIWDIPTAETGTDGRREVDIQTLGIQLAEITINCEFVIIEKVHSMPKQGVASTFAFGKATGIIMGMFGALFIPIIQTTPAKWKAAMHLTNDKSESRKLASKLYPNNANLFLRQKDHNKAEALLLAEFAKKFY